MQLGRVGKSASRECAWAPATDLTCLHRKAPQPFPTRRTPLVSGFLSSAPAARVSWRSRVSVLMSSSQHCLRLHQVCDDSLPRRTGRHVHLRHQPPRWDHGHVNLMPPTDLSSVSLAIRPSSHGPGCIGEVARTASHPRPWRSWPTVRLIRFSSRDSPPTTDRVSPLLCFSSKEAGGQCTRNMTAVLQSVGLDTGC